MALLLLCNHAGDLADNMTNAGFGSDAYGYDPYHLIAESRVPAKSYRTVATLNDHAVGYRYSSNLSVDYLVVARADWLLTAGQMRVKALQYSSGGVWSNIGSVDYDPLVAGDLIGPTAQDLVIPVAPTQLRGIALQVITKGTNAEPLHVSKFFGSVSFSFDMEPLEFGTEELSQTSESARTFVPLRGTEAYECEQRITFAFRHLTRDKMAEFKALPQLLRWPLFLYDSTGDLWSWKLEHVICEGWTETVQANDVHDLTVSFLRLAHTP